MKQVLDKQKMQSPDTLGGSSTSKLEILTKENNVLYVDFAKRQIDELQKLNKTVSESFGDKGDLSVTLNTIQENITPAKGMGQTKDAPPGLVGAGKNWMKDLFTVRGFLDKTSILRRGHDETGLGRVADKYLENREKGFNKQEPAVAAEVIKPNDAQPAKNETADLMQEQIELLEIIADNSPIVVEKLQKSLEEQSVIRKVNEGRVKFNADTGRYHEQGKEARNKMVKEADVRTTSTKGSLDPSDEGRVRTFTRVKKAKEEAEVENTTAKIIKFPETQSSSLGSADMTEAEIESQKKEQEQTELLKAIAENTGGATKPNDAQKPKTESGGGFLDGIMSMLGTGILNAAKFLFNPKNLLKAFTKFLLPAMIIGSLVNGIIDGFKAFMETGSIAEALIAGFGGILSFLTFGLIDAKTIRSIVDWFSGFVTDYIIQPLKDFFGFLGKSFDKYIAQPILEAFNFVGDMLNEYIVEPIKTFFAPLVYFFKNIKDQVFGFLEGFGIPEVGFTIPVIDKKVSIGPFFPFKKESSPPAPAGTSDAGAGRGSSEQAATDPRRVDKPSSDAAPKTVPNQDMSKAKITADEAKNILENGSKRDIEAFGGMDKLKQIAEGSSAKLTPSQPQTGNQVAAQSADSEMAKNAPASSSSTVIAPMSSVNNNSSSTYAIKPPVRNPNQGLQNQMQKRYGT